MVEQFLWTSIVYGVGWQMVLRGDMPVVPLKPDTLTSTHDGPRTFWNPAQVNHAATQLTHNRQLLDVA
jgi:hypothetical protein